LDLKHAIDYINGSTSAGSFDVSIYFGNYISKEFV